MAALSIINMNHSPFHPHNRDMETGVKLTTQEELAIAQEVRYSLVMNGVPGAQKKLDDMNEQLRLLETITDEAHNDYILFGFDL